MSTRRDLAVRLRERGAEIEEALLTRIYAIADPGEAADPEYAEGLRAAVSAALEYGVEAIANGEAHVSPLPAVLLTQARIAARNGISLDTVLRRYFAGYTLLGDFLMQEVEQAGTAGKRALKLPFRSLSSLFDRLIAAVTEEYEREGIARPPSTEQRRAKQVERLLAGEMLDASDFRYDFDAWHLGVVASGTNVEGAVRELAEARDCRLLLIHRDEGLVWAWLGSRRPPNSIDLTSAFSPDTCATAAFGEAALGLSGWRLTYRQATAAFPIALRSQEVIRYIDVGLLAAAIQNDVLAASLRDLYLTPLAKERDNGAVLRRTLSTYFGANRNAASTAAALGVSRQTVTTRLQMAEARLGIPLREHAAELELALRLHDLESRSDQSNAAT